MRTAIASLALFVFLALPVGTASTVGKPEEVGLSSERLQRVAQMIQRRIAAGDLAGAVVAVARKGRVAYVNAQGVMDLDTKQPMSSSSMLNETMEASPFSSRARAVSTASAFRAEAICARVFPSSVRSGP